MIVSLLFSTFIGKRFTTGPYSLIDRKWTDTADLQALTRGRRLDDWFSADRGKAGRISGLCALVGPRRAVGIRHLIIQRSKCQWTHPDAFALGWDGRLESTHL